MKESPVSIVIMADAKNNNERVILLRFPKRRLCVLITLLFVITALPVGVLAAPPGGIILMWENAVDVTLKLAIESGIAICSVQVTGILGTSNITATLYLQHKNSDGTFSNVETWSGLSSSGLLLTFGDAYSLTSTGTYRLICNASVTKGGYTEPISVYGEEQRYTA
jgi:hypothetical protein